MHQVVRCEGDSADHNHQDQSGGAFTLKEKSGAQVVAGFAEIPSLDHDGALPAGTPVANYIPLAVPGKKAPVAGGAGGGGQYQAQGLESGL